MKRVIFISVVAFLLYSVNVFAFGDISYIDESINSSSTAIAAPVTTVISTPTAIANQQQGQQQGQGQIAVGLVSVTGDTYIAEAKRDFVGSPVLPGTQLIPYNGPSNSLFAKMTPWNEIDVWTIEKVDSYPSCYFGCIIEEGFVKVYPATKEIKVGQPVNKKDTYMGTVTLNGKPLELTKIMVETGLEKGSTMFDVTQAVIKFEGQSKGLSVNLGGTTSVIKGKDEDTAYAAVGGLGGGWAVASQIEWMEVEVKYYK